MKKKQKAKSEDVNDKRIIWTVVAIGIIVIAAIIFFAQKAVGEKQFTYNGYTFTRSQECGLNKNCWDTVAYTNFGQHPITFYTDPRYVNDVFVDKRAIDKAKKTVTLQREGQFILLFEEVIPGEGVSGELAVSIIQVARILGDRLMNVPTKSELYGNPSNCGSGNETTTIILFTQGMQNAIRLADQGCIVITAEDEDSIIKVGEVFTMHLLGILWTPR